MFKIMTIVGTRPELIRLSRIIPMLDQQFKHILVHTGQNYDYELNQIFFDDLDIRQPNEYLEVAEKKLGATIGQVISKSDEVLEKYSPDGLLILGDTNSSLAAIAAKRRKIPIFHMEAGNRCFDFRVPEEINRKIVDVISDINLPYSQIAREYLISEGFPSQQIIKTGSPLKEVIDYYKDKITSSKVLQKHKLKKGNYIVCSFHREENVDSDDVLKKILLAIENLKKIHKCKVIVSTHPRTAAKLSHIKTDDSISFCKPFKFTDYVQLMLNSKCVLSDSGTITEESSILKFPAVSIRNTNERPEGFEEGNVIMSGVNTNEILDAANIVIKRSQDKSRRVFTPSDYLSSNVSEKIIVILQSYIPYINEMIWKKK